MKRLHSGIFLAVLAAALYALNSPLSKLLLDSVPPTLMAGILYLGAGAGMAAIALVRRIFKPQKREARLTAAELPYTVAMILLDIAAPICLLFGLRLTTAANASLLNNFEIVATAIVALFAFREKIGLRLWLGILLVTLSCLLLSFENAASLQFSYGSLFILLACVCWGIENNCTRKISSKDPLQIVLLKGIFSGTGSLVIGLCVGERVYSAWSVFRRAGRRFYRLRTKHFLLRLRPAQPRRRTHQRVLCRRALHRHLPLPAPLPRNAPLYLLHRPRPDGGRSLALCRR